MSDTTDISSSHDACGAGQASPDEPPPPADDPVDRRPTAFVVDLGGNESVDARRRLPADPLSRYVPPRVERSSAKRRADIMKKKLVHRRQVVRIASVRRLWLRR